VTLEEKIRRFNEATAAEEYLIGVVADPVHYSIKWGIPLSKKYLKDLENRRKETAKNGKEQAHCLALGR
jgi:hypothetical protein